MRMADRHPDRRHQARGLCAQCYMREYDNNLRAERPKNIGPRRRPGLPREMPTATPTGRTTPRACAGSATTTGMKVPGRRRATPTSRISPTASALAAIASAAMNWTRRRRGGLPMSLTRGCIGATARKCLRHTGVNVRVRDARRPIRHFSRWSTSTGTARRTARLSAGGTHMPISAVAAGRRRATHCSA